MSKYTIQKTTLDAIAAAIVDQTGDTGTITQRNMAAKIRSIDKDKITCKTIMSSSLSKELIVGAKLSCGVSMTSWLMVRATGLSYEVVAVDGAQYGFALNNNGYYESKNKGVQSSYAMCKINFNCEVGGCVYLDCINYAESNYDFGLFSNADTMLAMSNAADTNVQVSLQGKSSVDVQSIRLIIPDGESFVCVKFRKDGSDNTGNDSLQFKVTE